jgi:hypothetical protein
MDTTPRGVQSVEIPEDTVTEEQLIRYIDSTRNYQLNFHQSSESLNDEGLIQTFIVIEDSVLMHWVNTKKMTPTLGQDLFNKYWNGKYSWNINLLLSAFTGRNGFDLADHEPDKFIEWNISGRKQDSVYWTGIY